MTNVSFCVLMLLTNRVISRWPSLSITFLYKDISVNIVFSKIYIPVNIIFSRRDISVNIILPKDISLSISYSLIKIKQKAVLKKSVIKTKMRLTIRASKSKHKTSTQIVGMLHFWYTELILYNIYIGMACLLNYWMTIS